MTTTMISLKLENKFLKEIDSIVKKNNYQNRTELIRESLRKKVDDARAKEAWKAVSAIRGKSKRKISEEEYEWVREHALDLLEKKTR